MPRRSSKKRDWSGSGRTTRRSTRPWQGGPAESEDDGLMLSILASRQSAADGDWIVRSISSQAATKEYRCPGCQGTILPGQAHIVAWRDESVIGAFGGVEDRRHWHRPCWQARSNRR